ncbi:MAG: hypothetical protein IIA59_11525 [Candidatus Marinimicrobia bacterium]|nr:hypothetical protein [Candidatus Neomarinimicrobiota bacterium]
MSSGRERLFVSISELLPKVINKTLFATDDPKSIMQSEYVVVITGTPVDEHLNPQIRDFKAFIEQMIPCLRNHHTVIFRSTTQPGATKMIHNLLLRSILKLGLLTVRNGLPKAKPRKSFIHCPSSSPHSLQP